MSSDLTIISSLSPSPTPLLSKDSLVSPQSPRMDSLCLSGRVKHSDIPNSSSFSSQHFPLLPPTQELCIVEWILPSLR